MREIGTPRRVLVVGEGNGRFLAAFVKAHLVAAIDCVEARARMIELARPEVAASPVTFIHSDVRAVALARNSYDLVVTHFLLDCFSEETLAPLICQLTDAATKEAC